MLCRFMLLACQPILRGNMSVLQFPSAPRFPAASEAHFSLFRITAHGAAPKLFNEIVVLPESA